MSNRDGQSFVLSVVAALACAVGCAGKIVVDEGPESESTGSSGTTTGGVMLGANGAGGSPSSSASSSTGSVSCNHNPLLPPPGRRWAGSPESCPEFSPTEPPCEVPIDQLCVFVTEDSDGAMMACSCAYDANLGTTRWNCGDTIIERDSACPELVPETGTSCFGARSASCPYPFGTSCRCSDSESPTWSCEEPEQELLPKEPAGVDPMKPVDGLNDTERASICDWIHLLRFGGAGYADDPAAVDPDGFTTSNGCLYGLPSVASAALPHISREQCASNLALSSCEASVAELAECMLAFHRWDSIYGASCGRYLEQDGCSGTVVIGGCDSSIDASACRIQVE